MFYKTYKFYFKYKLVYTYVKNNIYCKYYDFYNIHTLLEFNKNFFKNKLIHEREVVAGKKKNFPSNFFQKKFFRTNFFLNKNTMSNFVFIKKLPLIINTPLTYKQVQFVPFKKYRHKKLINTDGNNL